MLSSGSLADPQRRTLASLTLLVPSAMPGRSMDSFMPAAKHGNGTTAHPEQALPVLPPGPPRVSNNPLSLLRYASALSRDPIEFQGKRFAAYGDTYTSHVGAISMLVTRDPDLAVRVLVEDAANYQKPVAGIGAAQLRRLLGNGLVSSNGDFWKEQRRQIQPAFAAQHIRGYAATMVDYAARWVRRWPQPAQLDVSAEMMGLTLQIVARVLMGRHVHSAEEETPRLMRAFRSSVGGLSAVLPAWLPYPPRWREQRATRALRAMLDELIEAHRRGDAAVESDCLLAVLSKSLEQPGAMSRAQLRDEALTLFFAGHETTSHSLSWTLYLLSQHPEVRSRLEQEVDEVLGGRLPTYEDAARLVYTGQVLQESMRLFPPAFALLREARAEGTLGRWRLPAGAHVLLAVYHMHHDPRYHAEPERFLPERFAPEAAARMHPGAYLPFGAGTRVCIGKRFAQLEATLLLATLCQSLRFELVQPHPPARAADITLAPRGGLRMRVQPRR
ncbi:MAG TPA: cytochrome P450 [Polyangiaceae bacterium]|nr:cytochrome P450 [Polyangiaceae bacterium]